MNLFSSTFLLYNVLTGEQIDIAQTPFKIGSGADSDLRLDDDRVAAEHCVFQKKGRKTYLLPCSSHGITSLLVDGVDFLGGELEAKKDYTLCIGSSFFALHGASDPKKWAANINSDLWYIVDKSNGATPRGPINLADLARELRAESNLQSVVVACRGLSMGFYAEHILSALEELFGTSSNTDYYQDDAPPTPSGTTIDLEYGEFTCPVCWLKFDRGDVMHIAVHGSLRGDPILGEDQMQRFHATRFNDRGQAIDAMAIPATDIACPHCRRKLPPGFLDTPHSIFSIVGAPSSGKSYYLSVLVKTLQTTLFRDFGISFRDADPTENVLLNQMKTQLFSAATPAEAYLAKTDLEGAMYETLPRLGRKVPLPKPFIFQISKPAQSGSDFSVVFYDNAGEHFQPGRNSADSPGAQHMAAASAIFFLFDPLHNSDFRARLAGKDDPQIHERRPDLDQQDVILAESEVRIKSLIGLDARQRISTPLAVLIGKCDTWLDLLEDKLENPVHNGRLDDCIIDRNSAILRRFLFGLCPAIVGNAEAISDTVRFFAVSAFGTSPVSFKALDGSEKIGPDPGKLKPIFVEVPTLWALSKIAPEMIPTSALD